MILQTIFVSLIITVNAGVVADGELFSEIFGMLHDGPPRAKSELNQQSESNRTVCTSEECSIISNMILSNIDRSVDPCDDFYQYACGNINASSMYNPFWDDHDKLMEREASKIVTSAKKADDPPAVKFMKDYFHSCVDAVNIEKQGVDDLFTTLTRIGGWPLLMNPEYWDEKEFTWQKVDDYYVRLIGEHTFFLIKPQQFSRTDNALLIAPPSPLEKTDSEFTTHENRTEIKSDSSSTEDNSEENNTLENEQYNARGRQRRSRGPKNSKTRTQSDDSIEYEDDSPKEDEDEEYESTEELSAEEKYANYIKEVARSLANVTSVQLSETQLAKDVDDMLRFYIELLTIIKKENVEEGEKYYLDEWEEVYNNGTGKNSMIKWQNKLKNFITDADVDIDLSNTLITIDNENYFTELRTLLDNTPKRTIVNYVHWCFLSKVLKTSTKKLRSLSMSWEVTDESAVERYNSCTEELLKSDMVAYEYIRKTKDLSKFVQMAKDMVDDIYREVEHQIKHAKWLNEKSKDYVLSKLVYMDTYAGYPKWINDTAVVNHYFGGLTSGLTYFENFLTYSRYQRFQELRSISRTYHFKGASNDVMWVNAQFIPLFDTVVIPAALLRSPFAADARPIVVNFALIGETLGHEINHAFDNFGIKYDKSGYELNETPIVVKEYAKRVECFIDQFNKYSLIKDANVTIKNYGVQTLPDNIADTMGIQATFKGFKRQERKCGKSNVALPGLEEFNDDQIFFLTYASAQCDGKPASKEKVLEIANDEHSINRLRVIGCLSNSNDFGKAFNCPVGSPMNPKKKCSIWE